jgi:putative ABC transport system permease protein
MHGSERFMWFSGAGEDLQHALRTLGRNPGFAVGAILLLALGIGANTAVFSVVRAVLLQPLPYQEPERLVLLWDGLQTRLGNRHGVMTGRHVIEIGRQNTTLQTFGAFKFWDGGLDGRIDLITPDRAERLRGAIVTPNFFELLGARATAGRVFASSDTDATPLAVISHGVWMTMFGSDPAVVGRQVLLTTGGGARTARPHLVIGVLPGEFRFTYPLETQIFVLMSWDLVIPGRGVEYGMIARLKPNVTAAQAQAELTGIAQGITRGYGLPPDRLEQVLKRTAIMAEPVQDHLTSEVRSGLVLLSSVAGLVLLIACVNLGLLLAARTTDRTGELAVRSALGAGPRRILRLIVIEGLTLAAIGGAAAVALAEAVQPVVRSLLPAIVPRADQIGIDALVLAFAGAATLVTGLVCGLAPGAIILRRDLFAEVRRSGGASTVDRRLTSWRRVMIAGQVAIVLFLLVGAGLLLHSFWRIQNVPLGFEADDVVTMELRLLNARYRQPGRTAAFQDQLLSRVRDLPGVESAGLTTAVPMRGVDFLMRLGPRGGVEKNGNMRSVDPTYFRIMRIPLIAGRTFSETDTAVSEPVMVVSESFARQFFGAESPIGRTIAMDERSDTTIVGMVGDVRYSEVVSSPAPAFYLPRAQRPSELICLIVRTQPGMREVVASSLRDAVRATDPEQPVEGLTTVGEIVSRSTADRRFYAVATGSFAAIALLLAMSGLFGVVSRSVTERRREFAIRVALGADSNRVIRLILAGGLLPVVLGCAVGLAGAWMGARLLRTFLFEIAPTDPVAFVAAAVLVILVAAAACLLPARRAVRVAPMAALKAP